MSKRKKEDQKKRMPLLVPQLDSGGSKTPGGKLLKPNNTFYNYTDNNVTKDHQLHFPKLEQSPLSEKSLPEI